jgi:hypothetical protein
MPAIFLGQLCVDLGLSRPIGNPFAKFVEGPIAIIGFTRKTDQEMGFHLPEEPDFMPRAFPAVAQIDGGGIEEIVQKTPRFERLARRLPATFKNFRYFRCRLIKRRTGSWHFRDKTIPSFPPSSCASHHGSGLPSPALPAALPSPAAVLRQPHRVIPHCLPPQLHRGRFSLARSGRCCCQ